MEKAGNALEAGELLKSAGLSAPEQFSLLFAFFLKLVLARGGAQQEGAFSLLGRQVGKGI